MKRPRRLFLIVTAAIAIFATGFFTGIAHMRPEPGVYQWTRVDCSEHNRAIDCTADDAAVLFQSRDSAIDCEVWGALLDLMKKCRASAIDGYGQESECNDGSTWVPRDVDHLDPQLSMMKTEVERQCGLSDYRELSG